MRSLVTYRLALLLLALFLVRPPVTVVRAHAAGDLVEGQVASAGSCSALATADAQLSQDVSGLNQAGSMGNPELCLLYYPSEDVYHAVILALDSPDQFRVAKADAMNRLTTNGFDLCNIVSWTGRGAQSLQLSTDDQLDLPVTCTPRVEAADAGAQNWISAVTDALNQTVAATADQMGPQPNRSAVVKVYTDANTAVADYQHYLLGVLQGETADTLTQEARTGQYFNVLSPGRVLTEVMLVNLTRAQEQNLAQVRAQTAFLYTGFAANSIGGSSTTTAQWFRQGLDSFQAERNAGAVRGYLGIAAGAQANGTVPHLQNLEQLADWNTQRRSIGEDAVQSRAHAAIVYLTENYGFSSVVQLLRQSNGGTLAQFDADLQSLAGTDTAGLDQALGSWLTSVMPFQDAGNGFSLTFTMSPASTYSEATITFTQAFSCGNSTVPNGTKIILSLNVQSTQSFSGSGNYRNGTLTLQGILQGNRASGTLDYADRTAGCDSGSLSFS